MDIVKTIDNYIAVADYVGDGGAKALLAEIRQNLGKQKYLLPFFGQFSAGKSRLINHLLGRELLPVKSSETTAFLTFISYGERETALVQYADGHCENICIDEVRAKDYSTVGDKIDSMSITLCNPILKNGLTIVDTPGVNTIVANHVEAAQQLLSNSLYMVYVLGKSPSHSDCEMIEQIEKLGVSTIFVRTKIDEMHVAEEDIFETIKEEKTDVEKLIGHPVKYFPVCNEKYSNEKIEILDTFDALKEHISGELASNIATIYAASAEKRIKILSEKFSAMLSQRETTIMESSQKSVEELRNQQTQVEMMKKSLEKIISANTMTQEQKIKSVNETIADRLSTIRKNGNNALRNQMEALAESDNYKDHITALYTQAVSSTCKQMGDMAEEQITNLSNETSETFAKAIRCDIPSVEVSLDLTKVNAICDEQNAMLEDITEKIARINELKNATASDLEQYELDRKKVEEIISGYDDFISKATSEVKTFIEEHKPTYIQHESKLGNILSGIGKVADIAMLFIPASGWASVAKTAGQTANKIKSTSQIANIAKNTLITVGKGAKAMSKADTALDITKLIGQGQKLLTSNNSDNLPEQKEKSTSFFDYLTLSHWFGKLGEVIDPPTTEIDKELENEFNQQVEDARRQIRDKVDEKIRQMQALDLITDEISANRKKQEMLADEEKRLNEKIDNKNKEMEVRRTKAINEAIRKQCVEKFSQSTDEYAAIVCKSAERELADVSNKIILAANASVSQQLDEASNRLAEIIRRREQNTIDDTTAIAEIASMKSKLQIV